MNRVPIFLALSCNPCRLSSWSLHASSIVLPQPNTNHQWHIILLAVCFYLLLDLVLQEGNQVCQRHLHLFPIFSSWKVDPHLFFFLLILCHVSCNLLCHCLHFGRLNLVLDVLMLILEDPFLYLLLEAVIWSLLDSLHILYQLCHMLS